MTGRVFLAHLLNFELQNSIFVFYPHAEANTTKSHYKTCKMGYSQVHLGLFDPKPSWENNHLEMQTQLCLNCLLKNLSSILQFYPSSKYSGDFVRFYSDSFISVTRFFVSQFHQTQRNDS